ncbi:MAG TPA: hypothetical protein DCM08_05580 [Microscillaceae bacterium]|nr:hypothetical protein [Microscillaceae bacterium]
MGLVIAIFFLPIIFIAFLSISSTKKLYQAGRIDRKGITFALGLSVSIFIIYLLSIVIEGSYYNFAPILFLPTFLIYSPLILYVFLQFVPVDTKRVNPFPAILIAQIALSCLLLIPYLLLLFGLLNLLQIRPIH